MFGGEAAKAGVHLEIVNVGSGTVSVDPAGKEKKRVIKLKLMRPGDKKPLEKQLGLNQTNKKSIVAAFGGNEYVNEWVGWITLYVMMVEDRKNGGMVQAIRVKNVRPNLKPTFSYELNVKKRKDDYAASAGKSAQHAQPEPEPEPEPQPARTEPSDLGSQIAEQMERQRAERISEEDKAAILAADRAEHEFTTEPDGEQ